MGENAHEKNLHKTEFRVTLSDLRLCYRQPNKALNIYPIVKGKNERQTVWMWLTEFVTALP